MYLKQRETVFERLKENCKSGLLIKIMVHRSNVYYSKIYQKRKLKEYTISPGTEENMIFQVPSSTLHLEEWSRCFRHRHSIKSLKIKLIQRLMNPANAL